MTLTLTSLNVLESDIFRLGITVGPQQCTPSGSQWPGPQFKSRNPVTCKFRTSRNTFFGSRSPSTVFTSSSSCAYFQGMSSRRHHMKLRCRGNTGGTLDEVANEWDNLTSDASPSPVDVAGRPPPDSSSPADVAPIVAEVTGTGTNPTNSTNPAVTSGSGSRKAMSLPMSRATLLGCAAAYGTLGVICKFVLSSPAPPTASMLSTIRAFMTGGFFLPILWLSISAKNATNANSEDFKIAEISKPGFWLAALDLAVCNAGGLFLVNLGLIYADATHASFLLQTSVCMVPLISVFRGEKVPMSTWLAVIICLAGVLFLSVDFSALTGASASSALLLNKGDFFCLASAFSFAMYTFRISVYAKRGFRASTLQAWKTVGMCLFCLVWLCIDLRALPSATIGLSQLAQLWPGWRDVGIWALLAFSALVPGAWADTMQTKSQAKVPASEAAIILATDPLWTAMFASIFLHETISLGTGIGGGLIVCAGLVTVFAQMKVKSS